MSNARPLRHDAQRLGTRSQAASVAKTSLEVSVVSATIGSGAHGTVVGRGVGRSHPRSIAVPGDTTPFLAARPPAAPNLEEELSDEYLRM
jgi:hypothetical protein